MSEVDQHDKLMLTVKPLKGSFYVKKKKREKKKRNLLKHEGGSSLVVEGNLFAHWLSGGIVPAVGLAGFSQTL